VADTEDWARESQLKFRADEYRGEARAEVNKLLAAVLENESMPLRQLLVFSVLIERATDLRDQVLDRYIEESGQVIQSWETKYLATLAGLSEQTVRSRAHKVRVKHWEQDHE
jgi:hypothetical protein